MRRLRTLFYIVAFSVLSSASVTAADEPETNVREQVQQERTQALDRLSRIRQRLDKMQAQLEQLNIDEIVEQRLARGFKPSGSESKPNMPIEDGSATETKREFTAPLTEAPLSFSSGTADLSNLTRLAFDTKRRLLESQLALKNGEKLFAQKVVAKEELQIVQTEHNLATEAMYGMESQITRTLEARQQMLDVLVQERSLAEDQVESAQVALNAARGTKAAILDAKRALLQLEQQGIHLKEVIDQLRELHKILRDRDE